MIELVHSTAVWELVGASCSCWIVFAYLPLARQKAATKTVTMPFVVLRTPTCHRLSDPLQTTFDVVVLWEMHSKLLFVSVPFPVLVPQRRAESGLYVKPIVTARAWTRPKQNDFPVQCSFAIACPARLPHGPPRSPHRITNLHSPPTRHVEIGIADASASRLRCHWYCCFRHCSPPQWIAVLPDAGVVAGAVAVVWRHDRWHRVPPPSCNSFVCLEVPSAAATDTNRSLLII